MDGFIEVTRRGLTERTQLAVNRIVTVSQNGDAEFGESTIEYSSNGGGSTYLRVADCYTEVIKKMERASG